MRFTMGVRDNYVAVLLSGEEHLNLFKRPSLKLYRKALSSPRCLSTLF